jgi:murein DD-endopeptidase MepM/ murein hydrolase activator NlpD
LQRKTRVAVAERNNLRYSLTATFGLALITFAASIGTTTSVKKVSRHSFTTEIPAAGDFDQQLAQKYFLLPTGPMDADIAAPVPLLADSEPSPIEQIIQVQKGDTLLSVLTDAGVKMDEAHAAIVALKDVYSPRQLKAGQPIKLTLAPAGPDDAETDGTTQPALQLMGLSLQPSVARNVELVRGDDGNFTAESTNVPLHRDIARAAGVIQSSLFEAGQSGGVPIDIMSEVIRAFSYDVDFQRDFQPGDRYEILYERYVDGAGQFAKTGNIQFASLTLSGRELKLYRYVMPDGQAQWFNQKGNSVRKALLRTPVDGAKITSSFGMRMHPILGYSRMHKGVDFGAPTGTPIYAAGDGVIAMIGPYSGFGNYVRIKHTAKYGTAYGHMSRFAGGLRVGSRVRQGQVIGYVGMTGRATGPHLHYEVLVNGAQINPQNVKLPTVDKLQGKELQKFAALVANIDKQRGDLGQAGKIADSH